MTYEYFIVVLYAVSSILLVPHDGCPEEMAVPGEVVAGLGGNVFGPIESSVDEELVVFGYVVGQGFAE